MVAFVELVGDVIVSMGSDVIDPVRSSRAAEAGRWLNAWLIIESCWVVVKISGHSEVSDVSADVMAFCDCV